MSEFGNLYPITKTRNVLNDNGDSLSTILANMQIESGLIENSTGDSNNIKGEYVKLPTGFFVFYYPKVTMEIISQPLYHRANLHFPFEVGPNDYTVQITLESGGGVGISDVKNIYIRNRYSDRVQISSVNESAQNESDNILCSVVVIGRV